MNVSKKPADEDIPLGGAEAQSRITKRRHGLTTACLGNTSTSEQTIAMLDRADDATERLKLRREHLHWLAIGENIGVFLNGLKQRILGKKK